MSFSATQPSWRARSRRGWRSKSPPKPRPINRNEVVDQVGNLLKHSLAETVEVRTEQTAHLPAANADPVQWEQVLVNLCPNTRDAILQTRRHGVSTDLIMPKVNGGEFIVQLRGITPELKIIVSTGYSADAAILTSINQRPQAVIQKPFKMAELARLARQVLDSTAPPLNLAPPPN